MHKLEIQSETIESERRVDGSYNIIRRHMGVIASYVGTRISG